MHDVLPYNYRSFIIAEPVRERSHHGVYEEKEAGALRELLQSRGQRRRSGRILFLL